MTIDGHTRLLGLIGTPVGHSKSPEMYNYCFEKYGLNCAYLAFDVDMEHVEDAVKAIRTFNLQGANVTMPLKNAVIPYLDEVSPASRAIGSVNTIVNRDGRLCGYVTDGMGYTGQLRRGGIEIQKGIKLRPPRTFEPLKKKRTTGKIPPDVGKQTTSGGIIKKKEISPLNFHHLPRGVIGCY